MSGVISFSSNNHTPEATLTSSHSTTTPLDWLKNEFRSRPVSWDEVGEDITITGTLGSYVRAEYFSIPESNLSAECYIKVELFDSAVTDPDLLQMEPIRVADLIALGQWRAGIDAFGLAYDKQVLRSLTYWFIESIVFQVFRITVIAAPTNDNTNTSLRSFMIGERLKLENNFIYDNQISFVSEPELARTSSGSYYPKRNQQRSRALSIDLALATDLDRSIISRFEYNLNGQPFVVSAYPDRKGWQFGEYTFLGRFDAALKYKQRYEDIHAISLIILEV